jgi:hypothetical protein
LEKKLPALLAKKERPQGARECLELGLFCSFYRYDYVAATGFFREAFTVEPKLAENVIFQHRPLAVSAALRAAAGKGKDAGNLNGEARGKFRQQALAWVQADLALCAKLADKKELRRVVQGRLASWFRDDDLAPVRAAKPLAALPEQERKGWQQLWQDVATLRQKVEKKE